MWNNKSWFLSGRKQNAFMHWPPVLEKRGTWELLEQLSKKGDLSVLTPSLWEHCFVLLSTIFLGLYLRLVSWQHLWVWHVSSLWMVRCDCHLSSSSRFTGKLSLRQVNCLNSLNWTILWKTGSSVQSSTVGCAFCVSYCVQHLGSGEEKAAWAVVTFGRVIFTSEWPAYNKSFSDDDHLING